jgi:hypothetical protein
MTDEELVRGFEEGTLGPGEFTHASHVRVAWWYLNRYGLPDAMARFTAGLKAFVASRGVPELYHETVTVAYLLLIAERLDDSRDLRWDAFAARHPELLAQHPPILARYYRDEVLQTPRARRVFLMPDRLSSPGRTATAPSPMYATPPGAERATAGESA